MIPLKLRLEILYSLGEMLMDVFTKTLKKTPLREAIVQAEQHNSWFTTAYIEYSLSQWGKSLSEKNLNYWMSLYLFPEKALKTVALITAGNIPLVGLHDLICVILSGHHSTIKLSSKDKYLLPAITDILIQKFPELSGYIHYTDTKIENFDALIATGTDNSARYFEYYFRGVPKIIRKNRSSVAILSGEESEEELKLLGSDIFSYYGLGCRNVSKLYIAKHYDFSKFFESIASYQSVMNHHKYANNYTYHKALFLMNQEPIMDNGFLLLKEDNRLSSPLGTLFYEFYESRVSLERKINSVSSQLQCVLSASPKESQIKFGFSQNPNLWDYADKVDTLDFLLSL